MFVLHIWTYLCHAYSFSFFFRIVHITPSSTFKLFKGKMCHGRQLLQVASVNRFRIQILKNVHCLSGQVC